MALIQIASNERLSLGVLQRIVVVERGPLSGRFDLIGGRDQKLFSQTLGETMSDFSNRVTSRLQRGEVTEHATILLGDESDLQARRQLCRALSRSLTSGASKLLEVVVRAGTAASESAWDLFEQMTRDGEFHGILLRLRQVD